MNYPPVREYSTILVGFRLNFVAWRSFDERVSEKLCGGVSEGVNAACFDLCSFTAARSSFAVLLFCYPQIRSHSSLPIPGRKSSRKSCQSIPSNNQHGDNDDADDAENHWLCHCWCHRDAAFGETIQQLPAIDRLPVTEAGFRSSNDPKSLC